MNRYFQLVFLSLLLWFSACTSSPPSLLQLSGHTMGTHYHITLVDVKGQKEALLKSQIAQQLIEFNQIFSTYIKDSEISRFNQAAADTWFPVSAEFIELVEQAEKISQLTQGYFDISIAPLVNLWGFGNQFLLEDKPPNADVIQAHLQQIGYQHLASRQQPPALLKQKSGLQIDLSAIAKGYAVDSIAAWLSAQGFKHYLVEIGGELYASGHNAKGVAWQVAIEKPTIAKRSIEQIIPISNLAVASSGNYRNYFEYQGQHYGHSLNPKTGYPVKQAWAAVTVIAKNTTLADAWATALMVLPKTQGQALAQQQQLAVLFIEALDAGQERWKTHMSPEFQHLLSP